MMHRLKCKCGAVRGQISGGGICNRAICYCRDCQAFARFLGHADQVLDAQGGTEIVQVAQSRLSFSQGKERLAAVRLSDKGMVRWYAGCCKTPIGNTMLDPKASFIGLIHVSLDRASMDRDFGADVAVLNVESAIGEPKPKQRGLLRAIWRFFWIVGVGRVTRQYRNSPLFNEAGGPFVSPAVLTSEERKSLMGRPESGV